MHGNEVLGRELMLALSWNLCLRCREGDPDVTALLNTTGIRIMHSMNPDGWARRLWHLAQIYAPSHRRMKNGETSGGDVFRDTGGITNGAAWYAVTGVELLLVF
ncbi:hypothetical protein MRX96_013640 [Rhipicephalus microplus]